MPMPFSHKLKHGGLCLGEVGQRGWQDNAGKPDFFMTRRGRMKMRKKRRFESYGSRARESTYCENEEDEEEEGEIGHDHVLTVYDHLDDYLAPSTLEVHRVRIPSERESWELPRTATENCGGNPSNETAHESRLEPRELTLSPDSFEEPGGASVEGFEKLLEMKFGIMALRIRHGLDAWSLGSLMVNPFEALSAVASTPALNRAYFKMWELIHVFALVPAVGQTRRFLSAHLCEGPGGFIEAVLDFRARSCAAERALQSATSPHCRTSRTANGLSRNHTSDHPERVNGRDSTPACLSSPPEKLTRNNGHEACVSVWPSPEYSDVIPGDWIVTRGRELHKDFLQAEGEDAGDGGRPASGTTAAAEQYDDVWFGLTLAGAREGGGGRDPPPSIAKARLVEKMAGNSHGHVHYGADGTGDVTLPANASAFVEYALGRSGGGGGGGRRMDLVTADGAFDVSEDFSAQEHRHLRLVFCEVVAALRLQAPGGAFVLKLFDCYTASTLTILRILARLYRDVEIVRLRTTRVCNSERYVVARGFLGLAPRLEDALLQLNVQWHEAARRGEKVGVLLSSEFPQQFLDAVMRSSAAISAVQVDGIRRALQLADVVGERLPPVDSFGRRKGTIGMLRRKLQSHPRMRRDAVALCNELWCAIIQKLMKSLLGRFPSL